MIVLTACLVPDAGRGDDGAGGGAQTSADGGGTSSTMGSGGGTGCVSTGACQPAQCVVQAAGDCLVRVCVDGMIVEEPDDDDEPACSSCEAGEPGPDPSGPYGPGLRFGAPAQAAEFSANWSHLSPSGLLLVQGLPASQIREFRRAAMSDAWGNLLAWQSGYLDLFPRYDGLGLGLFACHGGEGKCGYHRRGDTLSPFPAAFDVALFTMAPFDVLVGDGGAIDTHFLPTPDGATVAFASNRISASDDLWTPGGNVDLWTATTVDPFDPEQGYTSLQRHPASSATADDVPLWLSDDALTILFATRLGGDSDLDIYVAMRATPTDGFDTPVRVDELSALGTNDFITLPSIAAMQANGGQGQAYVGRTPSGTDGQSFYSVAVCVGP